MRDGNILTAAVQMLGAPPAQLKLWIGFGICGECNGYSQPADLMTMEMPALQALIDEYREAEPSTWMKSAAARVWAIRRQISDHSAVLGCVGWADVRFGPRAGQVAYDNEVIAFHIARGIGIAHVEIDPVCAASANRVEDPLHQRVEGQFWSNIYGHAERNLALAWMPA